MKRLFFLILGLLAVSCAKNRQDVSWPARIVSYEGFSDEEKNELRSFANNMNTQAGQPVLLCLGDHLFRGRKVSPARELADAAASANGRSVSAANRIMVASQPGFLLFLETATHFRVGFEAQRRPVNVIQQMSLDQFLKIFIIRGETGFDFVQRCFEGEQFEGVILMQPGDEGAQHDRNAAWE